MEDSGLFVMIVIVIMVALAAAYAGTAEYR